MNRLENIDELFRNGLKDYAPSPPEEMWGRIEQDLVKGRKNLYLPIFLKFVASIIIIAGVSWLIWRSFNSSPQNQSVSETEKIESSDRKTETTKNTSDNQKEQTAENIPAEVLSGKELTTNKPVLIAETSNELRLPSETPDAEFPSPKMIIADNIIVPRNTRNVVLFSNDEDYPLPAIRPIYEVISTNDLILQQNILALENQKKNDQKKNMEWSVGGQAGPQYTYRDVYVNTPTYPIDNYDKYESGLLAYAGGLHIEIEPAQRFSIQSGIYYSKIGQTKATLQIDTDIGTPYPDNQMYTSAPERGAMPDVVNSTGNITFDKNLSPPVADENIDWTVGVITAEQYFEYIEIPFLFRYLIIDRKINVNLCSGLWANFLVGNTAIATDNETFTTKGETEEINTFSYSGSVSIGMEYPFAKNININLEPFFKYYLSPINTNPETDVYPYSIGVLTGISYSF